MCKVSFSQDEAVRIAKKDLAHRLGVPDTSAELISIGEKDFPNASLGAPVEGEMSAQMISGGWEIHLKANGKKYEYRADKYQIRLRGFNGRNYVVRD